MQTETILSVLRIISRCACMMGTFSFAAAGVIAMKHPPQKLVQQIREESKRVLTEKNRKKRIIRMAVPKTTEATLKILLLLPSQPEGWSETGMDESNKNI